MKSVNFKFKTGMPSEITCVGTQYEETKELPLGQLILFIESRLVELANQYYEASVKFSVQLTEREITKEKTFLVVISTSDFSSYIQLSNQVEEILWSFNKQVFYQSSGRFYSHYVRFGYLIKKSNDGNANIKQAS